MSIKEEPAVQVDLYEILGIERNASQEEIKKNYNELVLIHHPDKGGDPKKFKDLQIAYKILSNEKNRQLYTDSLSSTFLEIASQYRDQDTGGHQSLSYEQCENDFMKATTNEEKTRKKEEFMDKFHSGRTQKDRELFEQMEHDLETKNKTNKVPTYEELLRQQEEELAPPTVDCLMTGKFDVNLFNQIFEQTKRSQCRELEPFGQIREQTRTDLAPIEGDSIFINGFDDQAPDMGFCTYQTCTQVDKNQFDLSSDITRTRDQIYEKTDDLLLRIENERTAFDQSIRQDPPPIINDTHELSYQSMGLNFK